MHSKYSFEKRAGYLYFNVTGEYNLEEFKSYLKIISTECEKEKIFKVLVDLLKVKNTNFPTMDRFFLGEEVARVLGSKIKIAVAGRKEDINKYGETVALNRGAIMNVVGDIKSAEEWLLNKS